MLSFSGSEKESKVKRKYFIKKDPKASKENTEWIEMTGAEFYRFFHSKESEGRYFVNLTDDITYESDYIVIESTADEYRSWRKEYDHHRYMRKLEKEYTNETVSFDFVLPDGSSTMADIIADARCNVEDAVINTDEITRMAQQIDKLDPDEKDLLKMLISPLYEKGRFMSGTEIGKKYGVSRQSINKRKKKILDKIGKNMLN